MATSEPDWEIPALQPVEIAEGVFILAPDQPEVEGNLDPDHPGRALFVPPEEEVSLYDDSAVLAAWASGDPSGLSDYDRGIYDGAKEIFAEILHEGMDDFSREAAVYRWVTQNVAYDYSHMDVMAETSPDSSTPYGGIVNRSAICFGYAATVRLLMELAGLECIAVVGTANVETHAWNMVRVNGEWYCLDAAWDLPDEAGGGDGAPAWKYFNVTSEYMARGGRQWDYDSVPEATAEDYGCP